MRRGGFNMYLTKEKKKSSIYRGYKPQLPNHQEAEVQVYVSHAISSELTKHMQNTVRSMSAMIVHGLTEGGENHG